MKRQIAVQICEALRRGDARTAWRQSRRLAATAIGPKQRYYRAVSVDPCIGDWIDFLKMDGPHGGMLAVPYARGDAKTAPFDAHMATRLPMDIHARLQALAQEMALPPPPTQDSSVSLEVFRDYAEEARKDMEQMVGALRRSKARKSVPQWSVSREVWLLALEQCRIPIVRSCLERLLMLIRVRRAQPSLWSVSKGCCIAKHNGKDKCKGQRVVHLLDPIGKAHAA
eukprot:5561730-Amphidinium_carterae.1